MVTKKKAPARARTRTVYKAAPRKRRTSSPNKYIPAAAATVGLVAANADLLKRTMDKVNADGVKAIPYIITGKDSNYKWLRNQFIASDRLIKDGIYYAGGYLGGEIIKKYAPAVIKNPLGKLAKKIPKV